VKYKLTDIYRQLKEEEQAAQVSQYKIYCDMDGVLCDFDRRFEQFGGMSPKEFESKYGTKKFWELIDKIGIHYYQLLHQIIHLDMVKNYGLKKIPQELN